jgi:serine/threonine-protein kinase
MAFRTDTLPEEPRSTALAEGPDTLIGSIVAGRFRVEGIIGKGAMGRVYRAVQDPLNRSVAIKVLDSRYGAGRDASFRKRFLVEAALTAKLSHPNTVRVLDYGSTRDGLLFLAMEHLKGRTLDDVLRVGPVEWPRVMSIAQQVARSLREAHSMGVVHRDLKPGNIMILDADDGDFVKVLDFGLVKSFVEGRELEGRAVTQQGMLVGSPPYMAPEQGEHNRADPRSDVYSLGVVLYEALAGRPPFSGGAPLELILKHVHEPVPPLVTPPGKTPIPELVRALVDRCLQKSPMDRFQSMNEVLDALAEIPFPLRRTTMETPPITPPVERTRTAVLAGGFAAALFIGAGLGWLGWSQSSGRPAPRATAPAGSAVIFHVESDPLGAEVRVGDALIGKTPVDISRPPDESGIATVELVVGHPGYASQRVTARGLGERIELRPKLVALRPSAPPKLSAAAPLPAVAPRPPAIDVRPKAPPARLSPASSPEKKTVKATLKKPAAKLQDDDVAPLLGDLKRPPRL